MEDAVRVLGPRLSRRSFFKLTAVVGSLHVVGSVLGGRVTAYADDAGNASFVVTVVCPYELSCLAVDAADGNAPLQGVAVTVTSHVEGRAGLAVTGVTDKWGIAVLDVKALSKQADNPHASRYSLYAGWEASLDGYREVAAEEVFLYAGPRPDQLPNIAIATQPFDAKKDGAYVRMASFDGYDVQYEQQQMAKIPVNTVDHDLHVQVVCEPGKTAHAGLLANGAVIAGPVSAVADAQGRADCRLAGPWVQMQAVGDAFSVDFGVDGEGSWNMPLGLQLIDPDLDYDPVQGDELVMAFGGAPGEPEDKSVRADVSNGTSGALATGGGVTVIKHIIDIPGLPFAENFRVVADLPFFPITYYMDAYGGMGIAVNFASIDLKTGKNDFCKTTKKCRDEWKDKQIEELGKALDLWEKANPMQDGVKGKCAKFGGFQATFDFYMMLLATIGDRDPETKKRLWSATAKAMCTFIFSGAWGAQLPSGPVPTYLAADLYVELDFSIQGGAKFENPFTGDWDWFLWGGAAGEGGIVIDFLAQFGFTAAVGVKGLVSFGVRGYCQVPSTVGWIEPPEGETAFPHLSVGITGGAQIVFQFLFFSTKWTFLKAPTKTLYDNWNNAKLAVADEGDSDALADGALALPVPDGTWHMTTDHDLLKTGGRGVLAAENGGSPARVTAKVNRQGVVCGYNFGAVNASLARANKVIAANRGGVFNPYADPYANGSAGPFDARKGLRPLTDTVLAEDAFSDPRIKKVQVGNTMYFCRLGLVEMDVAELKDGNIAKVVDSQGSLFVVPLPIGSGEGLLAGAAGADGSSAGANSPLPHVRFDPSVQAGPDGEAMLGRLVNTAEYAAVAHMEGGDELQPCVAQLFVERLGDEDNERLNNRMMMLAGLADGSRNAANRLAGLDASSHTRVPRTRVLVTPYDLDAGTFGETDVVEFALPSTDTGTLRCNVNDVDFDVIRDGDALRIGIVSATRPPLLNPTVDDAKKLQFTSTVRYDPAAAAGARVSQAFTNFASLEVNDEYEWKALPFATKREGKDCVCMVSTGVRSFTDGEPGFVAHYYTLDGSYLKANTHAIVPPAGMEINDYGELDVVRSEALKERSGSDAFALVWRYNESDATEPRTAVWTVGTESGKTLGVWELENALNLVRVGDGERGLAFSRPAPKLAGDEESDEHAKIYRAYFESATDFVEDEIIGTVDSTQFSVSEDGNYLYTMRIMEAAPEEPEARADRLAVAAGGDGQSTVYGNVSPFVPEHGDARRRARSALLAEDAGAAGAAGAALGADAQPGFYQMLCSMWDPEFGEYHPFFAFGQLTSAPDSSESFRVTHGANVLYSTITELESQKAQISFASIPYTTGLQLEKANCADAFIAPGATVHPAVCVSNTGNQPIRQFSVRVESADGDLVQDYVLDDLSKYVDRIFDRASAMSGRALRADAAGGGIADEERAREYLLWPGDKRTYLLELKTPESWSGQHELRVSVSSPVPADLYGDAAVQAAGAAALQAADSGTGPVQAAGASTDGRLYPQDGMVYMVDPRTQGVSIAVDDATMQLRTDPALSRCDYTRVEGGGSGEGGSGGGSNANPGTGDGAGSTALALGAAALAAGAAAAGAKALKDRTGAE